MSLKIDEDGTITIYQGDTGHIVVNGLDSNKNLFIYFAIQDKKRNLIGDEIKLTSNASESVDIYLPSSLTDKLTVPQSSTVETYYYGIKVSEIGSTDEDTLFIAGKDYGELNLMLVYPKQVEGVK